MKRRIMASAGLMTWVFFNVVVLAVAVDLDTSISAAQQQLIDGNKRYVDARSVHPNQTPKRRTEVAKGQQLKSSAPILEELIKNGQLKIVGARYDLDNGTVEILTS
jgi:carbonic anhydrase